MKTHSSAIPLDVPQRFLFAVALATFALAAPVTPLLAQPSEAKVLERGMCYRNWQWVQTVTDAAGLAALKTNAWTELGNGLCYLGENGQWQDSQDLIELDPATGGAVARYGPTKVRFSANATAPVVIDITTATGQRLQGRITSLHYFDAASGKEATIATVKDSVGILYAPNTLVFPDAFQSASTIKVHIDIRYVYNKGAFSQDLLLLPGQALPAPSSYGLDPETTRLQAWTEWSQAPTPSIRQIVLQRETDPQKRAAMVAPDLADDTLDFAGDLWFPVGAAFHWDGDTTVSSDQPALAVMADPSNPNQVLVGKHWIANATGTGALLIESANLRDLLPKLAAATKTAGVRRPGSQQFQAASASSSIRVASGAYRAAGLLWDYHLLSGYSSYYTFQSSTTYLISTNGSFTVGPNTATWQTGSCIKYATNAWLLVYGPVSFPSSGPNPVFTSQYDNAYGEQLPWSGLPDWTNAPACELWMYYETAWTSVQHARFRWAQRCIQYDENSGVYNYPSLATSSFENCNTGIYLNIANDTLYLNGGVITCNAQTPLYVSSGSYSGSTTPSANAVNASHMLGGQAETAIAINPANPANIVLLSVQSGTAYNNQPGLFCAHTTDSGQTWVTNLIAATGDSALGDPSASFDGFGNLFVAYADYPSATNVVVILSTDGGVTFPTTLATFHNPYGGISNGPSYGIDRPYVVTGPAPGGGSTTGSVWFVFDSAGPSGFNNDDCTNYVSFASVTGLGAANITYFSTPQALSSGAWYPSIAVGSNGEVVVSFAFQTNSTNSSIYLTVNTNGIYNPQWTTPVDVVDSNLPLRDPITPAYPRGIAQSGLLAFDLSGKYPHRLYLVYTDCPSNNTNNTLIKFTYSDNYGANWSGASTLNDDSNRNSLAHFFPGLAVDPVSGNVAVAWYDCRNDANNVLTQCFATVSRNGGASGSFWPNFQICPGKSNAPQVTPWHWFGYGDYTGMAYYGNIFRFVWADNSNNSAVQPPNPNSPNTSGVYPMNIYALALGF